MLDLTTASTTVLTYWLAVVILPKEHLLNVRISEKRTPISDLLPVNHGGHGPP
jgi:hypothetical protein